MQNTYVRVKIIDDKFYVSNKEVTLPEHQRIILKGMGEGSTITVNKTSLNFK